MIDPGRLKTRLTVQIAADLLPMFRDGAWLCELAVASRGSRPAMAWSMSAQSSAVRPIGPRWSLDQESGIAPARLTRP